MAESEIPERHIEFARELGALARKYKMNSLSGRFRPGFSDSWRDDIQFVWQSGRHEADVGRISLSSTLTVNTTIPK